MAAELKFKIPNIFAYYVIPCLLARWLSQLIEISDQAIFLLQDPTMDLLTCLHVRGHLTNKPVVIITVLVMPFTTGRFYSAILITEKYIQNHPSVLI